MSLEGGVWTRRRLREDGAEIRLMRPRGVPRTATKTREAGGRDRESPSGPEGTSPADPLGSDIRLPEPGEGKSEPPARALRAAAANWGLLAMRVRCPREPLTCGFHRRPALAVGREGGEAGGRRGPGGGRREQHQHAFAQKSDDIQEKPHQTPSGPRPRGGVWGQGAHSPVQRCWECHFQGPLGDVGPGSLWPLPRQGLHVCLWAPRGSRLEGLWGHC